MLLTKNNHRSKLMKLIREEVEAVEVLCEENKGKKTFYIQGPFLQGDITQGRGASCGGGYTRPHR